MSHQNENKIQCHCQKHSLRETSKSLIGKIDFSMQKSLLEQYHGHVTVPSEGAIGCLSRVARYSTFISLLKRKFQVFVTLAVKFPSRCLTPL